MEELLIALVQFFFEVGLELLGYLPFDLWSSNNKNQHYEISHRIEYLFWFVMGCMLAGLSLLFFHSSFIHHSALRLLNLLIAPFSSAYLSKWLAYYKKLNNPLIIPEKRFWRAFWFVFGLVLIRFAYAEHAMIMTG